jgi:hypothetical protein
VAHEQCSFRARVDFKARHVSDVTHPHRPTKLTNLHQPSLLHTDKKENQIFLIYREIQSGAVAKTYMRKGFLIYEEMQKYFPIYEEAVSHI